MRVFVISPNIPWPPTDGGRIVVYNTTKALVELGHRVGFVGIGEPGAGVPPELGAMVQVWSWEARTKISRWGALRSVFSAEPYVMTKFHPRGLDQCVLAAADEFRPDVVHVEFLSMGVYGRAVAAARGIPVVLRLHNVDSTLMQRFRDSQRNPLTRWFAGLEHRRLCEYERTNLGSFDRRVAITPVDAAVLERTAGVSVGSIPSGIDTEYYRPGLQAVEESTVVYVASMDWLPNVDSARWFLDEVWPQVRRAVGTARFVLVGRHPPFDLVERADGRSVVVTGSVEDVRPWLATAAVVAVPTRIGSGMRIKILEALAMGKPVVSTRVGCEGIAGLEDGRNVVLADDAGEFARRIAALLKDRERRTALGTAARALVVEYYQWRDVAKAFERIYRELVDEARS